MSTSLADDLAEPDATPPPSSIPSHPSKFNDFADSVFSQDEFNKLPPHRPYDVDIDIEEGKTPPFGPLYRLTPQEREALAEHINTNLARGHIRRSGDVGVDVEGGEGTAWA